MNLEYYAVAAVKALEAKCRECAAARGKASCAQCFEMSCLTETARRELNAKLLALRQEELDAKPSKRVANAMNECAIALVKMPAEEKALNHDLNSARLKLASIQSVLEMKNL